MSDRVRRVPNDCRCAAVQDFGAMAIFLCAGQRAFAWPSAVYRHFSAGQSGKPAPPMCLAQVQKRRVESSLISKKFVGPSGAHPGCASHAMAGIRHVCGVTSERTASAYGRR